MTGPQRDDAGRADELLLTGARTDDALVPAITQLRALAQADPPAPSAALTALLAAGAPVSPDARGAGDPLDAVLASLPSAELARRYRAGRLVAAVVVATGATIGLTGVAAANNALPEPAQSVVGAVLDHMPRFHPALAPRHPDKPRDVGSAPGTPEVNPGNRLTVSLPAARQDDAAPHRQARAPVRGAPVAEQAHRSQPTDRADERRSARTQSLRLAAARAPQPVHTASRHHRHRHHSRHHARRPVLQQPVDWSPRPPGLSATGLTLGR